MDERPARALRLSLRAGSIVWFVLLAVGFVAPGGWTWGLAGPIGHIENFMISLWFVTLVLAPLLASWDPFPQTSVVRIYLLGLLGIAISSVRNEPLEPLSDAVPLTAVAFSVLAVVWAHPRRSRLWRPEIRQDR